MRFWQRYGYETGLLLVITAFILLKIPDLSLPYFWDELGVYAPGALRLHDTHLTIMPGGLAPEYSRGHPMLCVFLYAAWMRIFGDGAVAAHCFSLLTGCATLLALYRCMKDLFSKPAALISVAICAAQPVFYAMSGVIMPEMLLTLFTILATWALLKKKWGHYMLAASLAILTKESGLTVLPAAVLFLFIESLRERDFFTVHRWKYFLAAAAPVLVFGLFLLVQKAQNGWYFFPLHIGYINYSWSNIRANIPRIFDDIFLMQGRRLAGLMFLLWCILTVVFSKKARAAYNAMLLFTLMIFCAMCFSSINFYLVRYLVYVVPFVAAGAAALMVWGAAHLPKPVRLPAVAVLTAGIVFLGYLNIDPKQFGDTSDMSYRHLVLNEQEAIRWAEVQPWRADTAVGANFPVFQALQDKRNGYLTGPPWPYSENCEMLTSHAILSHLDGNIPAPANRPYRVIRQFNREYSHITILEFQQP